MDNPVFLATIRGIGIKSAYELGLTNFGHCCRQ